MAEELRPGELVTETIRIAVREKHLPKRDLKRVTADTTVQEKNITYLTDSKLLYKAIVKLASAAKSRGIVLRQSYVRVRKRAAVMTGRYAHAKQFRRMHKRSPSLEDGRTTRATDETHPRASRDAFSGTTV